MQKLSANAAIAQPVERILGKDEVASSNLASSSIKKPGTPTSFRLLFFVLCALIPEIDTGCFYPNHRRLHLNSWKYFIKIFSLQLLPILV